jgi:hypothetical protein
LKFYEKIDIGGFAMRGNLIDHISVARFLRNGFKFSRASEVAQYALKRYGVILSIDQQNNLDSDVKNLNSTYEKAIIKVDLFALNRILKNKKKEVSNELEL